MTTSDRFFVISHFGLAAYLIAGAILVPEEQRWLRMVWLVIAGVNLGYVLTICVSAIIATLRENDDEVED